MKFKFSYEKLLQYHHRQEQIAQRDYNESLNALDQEKKLYHRMYDLMEEAQQEVYEIRDGGKLVSPERLSLLHSFMDGQKIKIERQREVVINHTQIVEQKQEILIAAAKERKIFEKLKEKKLAEYKAGQKKREAKLNDELVVTRFRRGESA